ncbi:MAG TPA: Coq4 family protein [Rhizomicrobium sp.]|nr:Coq4 family protein [Rhizomicrobium sp.]
MATMTSVFDAKPRRDWRGALRAVRRLLADPGDTVQVFRIMAALNAGTARKNYLRLLATPEGGRVAYDRVELVARLADREWLARFAPGTVGAAYRSFLDRTGFSAEGLAAVSNADNDRPEAMAHPVAWFGRRERDIHDVWHVLTGYAAEQPLGELCLVAFSYAQTRGPGWGFIALMGALKALRESHGGATLRAVWEGYRHGRAAKWLHNEDIEALFAEPLEAARARLAIAPPAAYEEARRLHGLGGEFAAA